MWKSCWLSQLKISLLAGLGVIFMPLSWKVALLGETPRPHFPLPAFSQSNFASNNTTLGVQISRDRKLITILSNPETETSNLAADQDITVIIPPPNTINLDGTKISNTGWVSYPNGTIISPTGWVAYPNGTTISPTGWVAEFNRRIISPNNQVTNLRQ